MAAYGWDGAPDSPFRFNPGSSTGRGSSAAPARAGVTATSIVVRWGERQSRNAAINREMLNRVAGTRI
jgi:hypothetical protein